MGEPIFIMIWRCEDQFVVLPIVDKDGEPTILVRAFLEAFDERGIDPAAAIYRGLAGDRAEVIAWQRLALREAAELAEWYRETYEKESVGAAL